MTNNITFSATTLHGTVPTVDRQDADQRIAALESGEEVSAEYNAMDIGKNTFQTFFGASTESKYGYAAEFDSVSRDYAKAIATHDYSSAASMDVVTSMNEKYQTLKQEIEDNYSGDEKESRLAELDQNYNFIMDTNVVQSTDTIIKNESAINKLKMTFANAYENAKNTKSSSFVQTAYGDMSGWKETCEEVNEQLEHYKKMFEQFKEALNDKDSEGSAEYANSILKDINAGLTGVKEKSVVTGQSISESSNERVEELWSLIETKSQNTYSLDKKYATDEEKYQTFLNDSKQSSAIDKRLSEILNEIIGEKK